MKRTLCLTVLCMLLAVQAYAKVIPIIHCWENDLTNGGGVVLYIGAENDATTLTEIPTGSLNYMSESHVPPSYFFPGMNGFMRKYSYGNPPATLSWSLSDGTTSYEVDLSTQATMKQCDPNGVVQLSFVYQSDQTVFPLINQQNAASIIEFILYEQVGFPRNGMGDWTWTSTTTGFTASVNLHRPDTGHSQYMAAALAAATAGDRQINAFTRQLNDAINVQAPVAISHLASNGTNIDTIGQVFTPTAPSWGHPIAIPPADLPENPVIPYADCWERNGTTVWMYFGYNNTNNVAIHVPAGPANTIHTLPDFRGLQTPETLAPGFSSFAVGIPINNVLPTQSVNAQWNLLNHYVNMIGVGSGQECKPADSTHVWIPFNGNYPTGLNIVNDLENSVWSFLPQGTTLDQVSVILNGASPTWQLEITIARGPVSPSRCAQALYNAFYHQTAFATALEALTAATPVSLNAQPTAVEVKGSTRASPMGPVPHPQATPPPPVSVPAQIPKKKLSGGTIFGIIFGVFAGIALLGAVIWYIRRPQQNQAGFEKLING